MGRAGPVPLSSHCSTCSHAQVDMAGAAEDVSRCPPCLTAKVRQPSLPQTKALWWAGDGPGAAVGCSGLTGLCPSPTVSHWNRNKAKQGSSPCDALSQQGWEGGFW